MVDAPAESAAQALSPSFRLEQFRDYLALEAGNSRHTVESYVRDVRRLVTHAAGKGVSKPDEVTAAQLREFVYDLKDIGLSPATIHRQISALRTYFRFLVGEGYLARNPSERIESPKRWRTLPTVLTQAETDRLLSAPTPEDPRGTRDRALLEFAYATGARVSELVGLTLQDILFEEGVARLFGKGAKQRLVPVGRRALGAVALYARETGAACCFSTRAAPRCLASGHGGSSRRPRSGPVSVSASRRIRCATRSRRTCSRGEPT
jgi:integrase/recombinase XerD